MPDGLQEDTSISNFTTFYNLFSTISRRMGDSELDYPALQIQAIYEGFK